MEISRLISQSRHIVNLEYASPGGKRLRNLLLIWAPPPLPPPFAQYPQQQLLGELCLFSSLWIVCEYGCNI